ncbi:hypothetical protein [Burkholderia pyrrocinia]|uniref:hypothetical protein n=1 Tax=Burkholderia pyrrocinia TaxID=60550 RepID=UPI00158F60E3|nr:hypothetical protein [Burkholderia pyrrocinia]
MEIAKCVLDDRTYTALEFSRLPPSELSTKRKHLVCIECQAAAFFRKPSRNGQAACFGAFPHFEGCSLASSDIKSLRGENYNGDVAHYFNESTKLDLTNAPQTDAGVGLAIDKQASNAEDSLISADDLKPGPRIRRQLSATLKSLIFSEKFRASSQEVGVEGESTSTVGHFFVNFKNIRAEWGGELRGYCGMLTDARLSSEGALWLNSGGIGDVSCVVQAEMVDEFFRRYNLEDEEDLAGAYVVVIGEINVSPKGKIYIRLADVDYIDLIKTRFDRNQVDQFFVTDKSKKAFLLTHNQTGVFDEELGIKRKHYIDKDVAKEWRARLAGEFHPDKNLGDTSLDYDQILSCINKMYNRMVGKA